MMDDRFCVIARDGGKAEVAKMLGADADGGGGGGNACIC